MKFLLTCVVIAATVSSCSFTEWDEIASLNLSPTLINKIPKVYPGGNVDCSQLNFSELATTTGRNNYIPSTDSFENSWPAGLLVKVVDDKFVSFQIDGAINLGDGKCYKIGAVIVKGGNASNVYNYTDINGATMDKGLIAPNNSSGNPADLSNLTFCFVEVECKDFLVALKVRYDNADYAMMEGDEYPFVSTGCSWGDITGVSYYRGTRTFNLVKHESETKEVVGRALFSDNGQKLVVVIELLQGLTLNDAYLYAGNRNYLMNKVTAENCPAYWGWPFTASGISSQSYTFEIEIDSVPLDW
jgi:hypothetical protein